MEICEIATNLPPTFPLLVFKISYMVDFAVYIFTYIKKKNKISTKICNVSRNVSDRMMFIRT